MGDSQEIYEEEEIDGVLCKLVHNPGVIERLPADDGVYEGEVADVLEDGEKVRTIPHGRGTFRWNNLDVYEGEWRYNKQNGKGKFTYGVGGYYQGDWENDEQHGYGFLKDCNGEYEGEFEHECRSGKGKQVYNNNDIYTGEWGKDMRHGRGTQKWQDGAMYDGMWANDAMNGQGSYIFENGDRYSGDFNQDQKTGIGEYVWADSADQLVTYVGGFLNGKRNGEGIERYKNGNWQIGEWRDGVLQGEPRIHRPDDACTSTFHLASVQQAAEEIKPFVSDRIWEMVEEAHQKGHIITTTIPSGMEEELRKAQQEIRRAGQVVDVMKDEHSKMQVTEPPAHNTPVEDVVDMGGGAAQNNGLHVFEEFLKQHGANDEGLDLSPESWKLGNMLGKVCAIKKITHFFEFDENPLSSVALCIIGGLQCNSATVQQCNSATVQQCNSATVQQCNSATVQQCNSATVQQCNSATVQQCNSATVQQCNSAVFALLNFSFLSFNFSLGVVDLKQPFAYHQSLSSPQGSYGAVYAGLRRDGGMMAVKCIELGEIEDEEDINSLINEIGVMKKLQHTNIVSYLGARKVWPLPLSSFRISFKFRI